MQWCLSGGLEATHKLARLHFGVGGPMYKVHGSTFWLVNQCTKFMAPLLDWRTNVQSLHLHFLPADQCTKFMAPLLPSEPMYKVHDPTLTLVKTFTFNLSIAELLLILKPRPGYMDLKIGLMIFHLKKKKRNKFT